MMTDQRCEWKIAAATLVRNPLCGKPAKAIAMDDGYPMLVCGTHRNMARRWGHEIRELSSRPETAMNDQPCSGKWHDDPLCRCGIGRIHGCGQGYCRCCHDCEEIGRAREAGVVATGDNDG